MCSYITIPNAYLHYESLELFPYSLKPNIKFVKVTKDIQAIMSNDKQHNKEYALFDFSSR